MHIARNSFPLIATRTSAPSLGREILSRVSQSIFAIRAIAAAVLIGVASGSNASAAQLVLNWTDNSSNETGFKIERSSGGGAFSQIGVTSASVTSYTDANLPAATSYTYRVAAYNEVGTSTYTTTVTATTAAPANTAPTLSSMANRAISANTNTGAISFTVNDAETAVASLTVAGASSNTALVPNASIVFGGSGANRTVTITPTANQSGSAIITVTVSDGGLNVSGTFTLTVSTVNTSPTISDIANRAINANSGTGPINFTIGDAETATGSLTVTGSSSNPTLISSSNITFGGSGANRTVAMSPNANQTGNATVTVSVSDGALSTSDSFVVTVNAVNTAPTISDIANRAINANSGSGPINFTIGDGQTAAGSLTVTASSSNTTLLPNSSVVVGGSGANRTVSLTPASNQAGTTTVTVTVSDGSLTSSDSFVLTVNVVNTAPTISDISNRGINANSTTGALPFVIGDSQTAPDSLAISAASSDATLIPLGNIVLGGSGSNRTITVIPAADQSGIATISITVSDGQLSVADSFTVTVHALNTPPTISPIANRTIDANGSTGALSFTVGDADTAVGNLVVTAMSSNSTLTPPANIVLGGSGATRTVTVTPANNQTGTATITILVNDGDLTTTKIFTVTVNAVVTAPTITDIANRSIDASKNTGSIGFTVGHATITASNLLVTGSSSNPTLVPNSNIVFAGSGADRTLTVTPTANLTGSATITVIVSDGNLSASDSFVLTVNAVNTAPTLTHVADRTINANGTTGALAFTVDDSTTPAGNLVVTAISSNTSLLPNANILFGGSGANRTVTFTPAVGQSGIATVTLTVTDGNLATIDSLTLTVIAVNAAPTITDMTNRSVAVSTSTGAIPFTVGDAETSVASLTVTAVSSNPTLLPQANIVLGGSGATRTLSLTPVGSQSGNATVTVVVSDGNQSASTSFVLTVNQISNTAPTISDISNRTIDANAATGPIGFSVGDTETALNSLTVTYNSSNVALLPPANVSLGGSNADRTVSLTPVANQTGSATVTITVSDGTLTASTSFVLTVSAPATAPTITPIANRSIAANASTGAVAFIVGDAKIAASSLVVTAASSNLTLVPQANVVLSGSNANRTVTITPITGQSGASTITLTVSNGTLSTNATFDVTVTAPNTAPTISAIGSRSIEANQNSGPISFTVGDTQTPADSLTLAGTSSNTALVPHSAIVFGGSDVNRTVAATPVSNQTGTAIISVTVSDGSLTAVTTFSFTVSVKNTAPTISSIANRSADANSTLAPVNFTVGDSQTAANSLTVTVVSTNSTLAPVSGIILGGSAGNRTATVTPATNQTGTSTITITVSDGELTASSSFLLTVNTPNSAPTISAIANRSTVVNRNSGEIEFTVGDAETSNASLTVYGSSSNTSLLAAGSIVVGGNGANRTVVLTPTAGQMGSATITLTVSDGQLSASSTFVLTVTASSTAPKISDLPNRTISVNNNVGLTFTVSDAETAAGSLTLSASSQNTTLVPTNNIVFGGSGGNRTVVITPAADRTGIAGITVTVSDGTLTSSSSFSLVVNATGNAPVISPISNRSIDVNSSTGAIDFLLTDPDSPATSLTLSATSSNSTLVSPSDVVLGGNLANRTVAVTPATNRTGNTMITITANDGVNSTSRSFQVTVNAVNTAPTITDIANRTIAANASEIIGFVIADVDTPAGNLILTGTSSNQSLLRNADISFSGAGTGRTMTVTPAANQSGTTTISVIVSDGNLSVADSFVLTVLAPSSEPGTPPENNTGGPDFTPNQPGTPTEQPVSAATNITQQPQSKIIPHQSSTTLSVAATGAQPLSYQWYIGNRGDTGSPIAGATSSTYTTPVLTETMSYWVRVTSPVDSTSSQTAVIAVSAGDRIFFGEVGVSGTGGSFGLLVRSDNTGLFVADASGIQNGISASGFAITQSGSFVFNVPELGSVSGQIAGSSVTGTIGSVNLTFAGTLENANGATAALAGLYDGAVMNTSDGEIITLAGSAGRVFVGVTQHGMFEGSLGALSNDGAVRAVLRNGRSVEVLINSQSGRLTGTLATNGKSLDIGGQREDVAASVRVSNLSVLAHVGQGSGSLISGFSIGGTGSKRVLIRAAGPSLSTFGVSNPLSNPVITVFRQDATNTQVAQNDDWISGDTLETSSAMGAFPFQIGSKDAALVLNLPAGGYTAQITGADGSTGTALLEVYDAGSVDAQIGTRLTNISLRGEAGSGDKAIVTGFNITGDTPKKVLVRAVGSELAEFGVPGTLTNPQLGIYKSVDGQIQEVATNDDWGSDAETIARASAQQGAFALTAGSKSAAIVVWLAPGTYTAHAKSGDDSSGAVLVEVYEMQ